MPDARARPAHLDRGGMTGLPSVTPRPPAAARGPGTVVNQVMSEGVGGVVNELLVQLQSFDEPTGWQKARTKMVDRLNLYLPLHRQLKQADAAVDQPAADRGDQPGRQPRPGAAATGPLRPAAHLRAAEQERPPGADRPLPRHQGARPRARRRGAARRAGRGHPGLLAGDDRAPLRRGAGQRGPPRRAGDELERRRQGAAGRGGRHGAAGRLHRPREAADRHPRGRARHGRLAGRAGAPARGPHDHQAPLGARPAGARRPRRGLHPVAQGDDRR